MANIRQYIGARYVIKIYENSQDPSSAEWEQGNFEPLVMVTWQNGSYLSKKEVPGTVGNPANNPDYWVQTGFYNGQIAELQQAIQNINSSIDDINAELSDITDGYWAIVTDSYGSTSHNPSGVNDTIVSIMRDITGKSSDEIIDCCYSGSGFVFDTYGTFESHIITTASTMSDETNNKITKIVVIAGRNDHFADSADDIVTAIGSFNTTIKSLFPHAQLYVGYVANAFNGTSDYQGTKAENIMVYNAFKRCNEVGAIYLTGIESTLHKVSYMSNDGVHPSIDGKRAIALNTIQCLKMGSCEVMYPAENQSISAVSGVTVTFGTLEVASYLILNNLYTLFRTCVLQVDAENVSTSINKKIGTLEYPNLANTGMILATYGGFNIPIILSLLDSSNNETLIDNAYISINADREVFIKVDNCSPVSNVTRYKIFGGYTNVVPAIYT